MITIDQSQTQQAILQVMLTQALLSQKQAYSPYSQFSVGCCVRSANHLLFNGCNVENAAYPSCQCAEVSAISAMIVAGEKSIIDMVIVGSNHKPCPPCGNCRQVISEFATDSTHLYLFAGHHLHQTLTLRDILPYAFNNHTLCPE